MKLVSVVNKLGYKSAAWIIDVDMIPTWQLKVGQSYKHHWHRNFRKKDDKNEETNLNIYQTTNPLFGFTKKMQKKKNIKES